MFMVPMPFFHVLYYLILRNSSLLAYAIRTLFNPKICILLLLFLQQAIRIKIINLTTSYKVIQRNTFGYNFKWKDLDHQRLHS
jgi:hypothetical protein